MSLPTVSIGVPTYNREKFIGTAIRSVGNQDYQGPLELVLVDDGSTDGTLRLLEKYKYKKFPRPLKLKVVSTEHVGIAHAKNIALKDGTGEIRGILDSDDFYERQFVRKCVDVLTARPDVDIVYTDNYEIDGDGIKTRVDRALPEFSIQGMLETCNMRGDCWLARWSSLQKTEFHDERFRLEVDYVLFYELVKSGAKFAHIPELLHGVRDHAGRTTRGMENAAYWHAAALAKYGYDIKYAFMRADRFRRHKEWEAVIREGFKQGEVIREEDALRAVEA